MSDAVWQFGERMAKLRQVRARTGAPMSACDEALKACGGDVEAACTHGTVVVSRGYDGDPRHVCRDDCPPWPFTWGGSGPRGGHSCSTHCRRHPDPRAGALAETIELLNAETLETVTATTYPFGEIMSICDWNPAWTVRFMREAGALG